MDLGVDALYETPEQRLARLLLAQSQAPQVDEAAEAQAAREAAAMRMRQAAMPEGGRQEGGLSAALSDPATVFNMSPLGMARDTMQAVNEGDYGQAAQSAAPLLALGAGPVVRGAGALMQAYPKASALGAGLAGMLSSAEAGPKLTDRQQQRLEMQKQGAANQLEAERIRAQQTLEAEQARNEMERTRRNDEASFAEQQRQAEIEAQRQEAEREANMPFRERYPNAAAALPFAGVAAAAASPYAVRLGKALFNNSRVGQMESAIARGEKALAFQDKSGMTRSLGEMNATKKTGMAVPEGPISAGPGTLALSAALPAEAALFPMEYDAARLPSGSPNQTAALATLTDPKELAKRIVPSLLQGVPAATLGNKLPAVWPERIPPNANIEGLIAALRDAKPKRAKRQPAQSTE